MDNDDDDHWPHNIECGEKRKKSERNVYFWQALTEYSKNRSVIIEEKVLKVNIKYVK